MAYSRVILHVHLSDNPNLTFVEFIHSVHLSVPPIT